MISHKYKFIFIHIPKAAGTTIEKALYQYASDSFGSPWAKKNKCYRNKELFKTIETHPDYYTFTFSRNPYSKIVSLYHFFNFYKSMSFERFLAKACEFIALGAERIYSKMPYNATGLKVNFPNLAPVDYLIKICNYPFHDNGNIGYHILPQSYFITQKDHINFIGKTERLQQDFDDICDTIGIPQQKIPHLRKTKHKHYTKYYNNETREIVARYYAKDIEYFGYKFGE